MTPVPIPLADWPEPEPKVRAWTNKPPRKQPTARERGHSGPYVPWVAISRREDDDR
jgi:hypothetical protein